MNLNHMHMNHYHVSKTGIWGNSWSSLWRNWRSLKAPCVVLLTVITESSYLHGSPFECWNQTGLSSTYWYWCCLIFAPFLCTLCGKNSTITNHPTKVRCSSGGIVSTVEALTGKNEFSHTLVVGSKITNWKSVLEGTCIVHKGFVTWSHGSGTIYQNDAMRPNKVI